MQMFALTKCYDLRLTVHTNHVIMSEPKRARVEEEERKLSELEANTKKKSRAICFTIHKAACAWISAWAAKDKTDFPPQIKYMVAQLEVAPETGKHHVQGYVELENPTTYKRLQDILGSKNCHCEARRGTAEQAANYCKKEESRADPPVSFEYGTISKQGARNDLAAAAASVVARGEEAIMELAHENPALLARNIRGLKELNFLVNKPKMRDKPKIYFLWGKPGCGKSKWAHESFPDAYYAEDTKEGWFDGYYGEKVVIFDEFQGNFPLGKILKLADYYPIKMPTKGAWVPIRADTFVFTANYQPEEMYSAHPQYDAWLRRLRDFATIMNEEQIRLQNEETQEL